MKKLIFLFCLLSVFSFTSCKKDYNCNCVYVYFTDTIDTAARNTIPNISETNIVSASSRYNAQSECRSLNGKYVRANAFVGYTGNCELK